MLEYDSRTWQIAFNKATELHNAGRFTEASDYFSNALGAAPGNYAIIDAYSKTMFALAEKDTAVLPILESFLISQVPLINVDEVGKVLALLEQVRRKMTSETNTAEQSTLAAQKLDELQAQIANGTFNIPEDSAGLRTAFDNINDLLDDLTISKARGEDTEKIKKVAEQIQKLIAFAELNELLQETKETAEKTLETSVTESASIAECQVQECEQILRQMIALHLQDKTASVNEAIGSLRILAKRVAETKSAELWVETLVKLTAKKQAREKIRRKDENSKGIYQLRLEALGEEMTLLHRTFCRCCQAMM